MKFEKYRISETIKENLAQLGFKRPTDIQFRAIPSILNGEDVMAVAHTGTGKTAAFAIPLVDRVHRAKSGKRDVGIKCIVMVPTRELAVQIGDVFANLSRHTRVKPFAVIGGVEQDAQIAKLQEGLDILIATPGRMFDLIHQGHIRLARVDTLVLDEADRMLDPAFIRDIQFVKKMLPQKHQTLFFSATINPAIKKLAFSQVRSNAIRIQVSPDDPVSANVSHAVMFVEMDDKRFFLERFIRENPDSKMIVFVRTRVRAERVARAMERVGIPTITLHGEKDQAERLEVMRQFKAANAAVPGSRSSVHSQPIGDDLTRTGSTTGPAKILIATDVSARGIDIPDVNYVINYDLPEKAETYVHRVGRTGRGVRKGIALSFCSEEERGCLEEIEGFLTKPVEVIKVGKKDYARTVDMYSEKKDVQTLIREHEAWLEEKKRKKAKKRG